jgi:hypothetical protein
MPANLELKIFGVDDVNPYIMFSRRSGKPLIRFCRWSVAPLRFGFPDGTGDAVATVLQRNNFS